MIREAFERLEGAEAAPVLLTCEHASERMPEGWAWPATDRRLVGTHWAFDLGARELTRELAERLAAPAVLSRFSRLLVDPNREEDHGDLFRKRAEGETVALNAGVGMADAERRLSRYYRPYHGAVDTALAASRAPVLLSIHSFTPLYERQPRSVEIGVLFNDDEPLARELGAHLAASFSGVAFNEPWSGREGLIYAAESHARAHGRQAVELEVRQDRACDPAYRAALTHSVAAFFSTR